MELPTTVKFRKRSSSKMAVTKQEMLEMDANDICEWELENLEAGLIEFEITIGPKWTKSRKAVELNKTIIQARSLEVEPAKPQDYNMMMLQCMQASQQQNQARAAQMQAIAEKVSCGIDNNATNLNKRSLHNAKGHRPEKLERKVDYATFLQWEKTWKL